mgnify:CR=1 FL=1|tara:strand:- start:552 stop:806 length:255 start_codon:yes stop_codon:yes gene_type:complete
MRFSIPGLTTKYTIRFFEKVETVNDQFNIVDLGLETPDGIIDSIAFGGAFSSAKKWLKTDDSKKDKQTSAPAEVVAIPTEQAAA